MIKDERADCHVSYQQEEEFMDNVASDSKLQFSYEEDSDLSSEAGEEEMNEVCCQMG